MVYRRKGDLAALAREVLTLFGVILDRASDVDVKILALRLVACCQSHTAEFLDDILHSTIAAIGSSAAQDANAVAEEAVRMLAYLANYVPMFSSSIYVNRLLELASVRGLKGDSVVQDKAKVREDVSPKSQLRPLTILSAGSPDTTVVFFLAGPADSAGSDGLSRPAPLPRRPVRDAGPLFRRTRHTA
jgi:hypothetical protein